MNDTRQKVEELEAQLERARADQRAQTCGQQVRELKSVIRELNEKELEFAQVAQQVKLENELIINFIQRIRSAQEAVGASYSRRPETASWLTAEEDDEIASWEKSHKKYEATLVEIIRQRDQMPKVDRNAATQLQQRVEYLRQVKLNLLNALNGSFGKLEGGIFTVG